MGGRGGYGGAHRRGPDPDGHHVPAHVARLPGGRPPDRVRRDHRRRRGRLHARHRRGLSDAGGDGADDRDGPATRHLGLDLGGHEPQVGRASRMPTGRGPRSAATRSRPASSTTRRACRPRSSPSWRRSRDAAIDACGPVRERGHRRARAVRPRHGRRPLPAQRPRAMGGPPRGRTGRRRRVGVPAHLINDARAFGLAELRLGAGRGATSMVGLTLGTGVGGVVAVDGRVHQGHDGTARRDRPPDDRSRRPLVRLRQPRLHGGVRPGRPDRGGLRHGDAPRRRCAPPETATPGRWPGLADVGRYLGIGIANMITVISPDRVVLGGGMSAAGDLLFDPIRAEIARRVHDRPRSTTRSLVAGRARDVGRLDRRGRPRRGAGGAGPVMPPNAWLPHYRQIELALRARLRAIRPGERLPSDTTCAASSGSAG